MKKKSSCLCFVLCLFIVLTACSTAKETRCVIEQMSFVVPSNLVLEDTASTSGTPVSVLSSPNEYQMGLIINHTEALPRVKTYDSTGYALNEEIQKSLLNDTAMMLETIDSQQSQTAKLGGIDAAYACVTGVASDGQQTRLERWKLYHGDWVYEIQLVRQGEPAPEIVESFDRLLQSIQFQS